MKNNEPTLNQTQSTTIPSTPPVPSPQPISSKKTQWLMISLIVILFGTTGYLGYQNYQLKQQLAGQQPSTQPLAQISDSNPTPVADLTVDWKIFNNGNYSYSLKYPSTWDTIPSVISGSKSESVGLHNAELLGKIIYLHSDYTQNPTMPFLQIESSSNETQASYNTRKQSRPDSQEIVVNEYPAVASKQSSSPEPGTSFDKEGYMYSWFIYNNDLNTIYEITCAEDMKSEDLCNQVMSTFQFTD